VGWISSVSPTDGTITVVLESAGTTFKQAIPAQVGLSTGGASWQRLVPQRGTRVLVGYDVADRPRVLSYVLYESLGGGDAVDAISEGYAAMLARGQDPDTQHLLMFTALKAGEWDMKSAGGAYIKGDNAGQLLLAGRADSFAINGSSNEIKAETGRYNLQSRGSYLRFGDHRSLRVSVPPGPADLFTEVPMATGSGVSLDVLSATRARFQLGDIRGATVPAGPTSALPRMTTPLTTLAPQPVVFSLRAYPSTLPAGGPSVPPLPTDAATHEGMEVLPPMASVEGTTLGALALQASVMVNVSAPITAIGPVPAAAINPAAKAAALVTALTTLAAQLSVIGTAMGTLATPVTGTVNPAAAAAITGACQVAAAAINTALPLIPSPYLLIT